MLDPNAHVSIRQYGVLTGDLEKSISGEIVVDGEILPSLPTTLTGILQAGPSISR